MSHIARQTIVREKTLIVFDEVQLCERAVTSLKYFCEDASDYHITVQFSRKNTPFQYKLIKKGGRASEFENAIEWLCLSGIVSQV